MTRKCVGGGSSLKHYSDRPKAPARERALGLEFNKN